MKEPQIKFQKSGSKRTWIIGTVIVAVILLIAGGTYLIVQSTADKKQEPAKTQTVQQKADAAKESGIKAEANGDNSTALKNYQTAQDAYKQAGNTAAADDMGYKVEFMKQAIKTDQEATAEAIKNGDAPTKDEE